MPYSELYQRQVALLVRILPYVAREECFALKGGTAINLFLRDMPRLSVDIDLTYLPVAPRQESLAEIDAALKRIAIVAGSNSPAEAVFEQTPPKGQTEITRLLASGNGVQIKIEVTPVLRGCVFDPELRTVSPAIEETYGFAEAQVASFPDLYAGKLVAALDRQHPRDLFDVRSLLANEGIDDALRAAFIVYLISHNRPMHEVLSPMRKDITQEFERNFAGMTEHPVALEQLLDTREQLIATITEGMTDAHREFLISFKQGNPDWSLLGIDHAVDLPAVKWKQQNLDKLDPEQRFALVEKLRRVLEETGG